MNIIFSHGFKIKSGLSSEAEIVYMHPPDRAQHYDDEVKSDEGEEIIYIDRETLAQTYEYECYKCKHLKHSDFLEEETSKLYKTCNKYKIKLENIRENINSIIKENTDEDDYFYRTVVDTRMILDDESKGPYGSPTALPRESLSAPEGNLRYPIEDEEEEEEEEKDLPPPLVFF